MRRGSGGDGTGFVGRGATVLFCHVHVPVLKRGFLGFSLSVARTHHMTATLISKPNKKGMECHMQVTRWAGVQPCSCTDGPIIRVRVDDMWTDHTPDAVHVDTTQQMTSTWTHPQNTSHHLFRDFRSHRAAVLFYVLSLISSFYLSTPLIRYNRNLLATV